MTTRAMAMRMTDENDCGSMHISVLKELVRKRNVSRARAQRLALSGSESDLVKRLQDDDAKQQVPMESD